MTEDFEIYKCVVCSNIVEVIVAGGGELVCCGKPMEQLREKSHDIGVEKHIPVMEEQINGDILVKVGQFPHPMEQDHYIKMIEVFTDDGMLRKYLKFNQKPEFLIKLNQGLRHARALCNLHGLWKGEKDVI